MGIHPEAAAFNGCRGGLNSRRSASKFHQGLKPVYTYVLMFWEVESIVLFVDASANSLGTY